MFSLSRQTVHELYLNCQDELETALFVRLRCQETAADISQEAFLRLCRSEGTEVENPKAYLFRIALNLVNDHYRRRSVREAVTVDYPDGEMPEVEDRRSAETVYLAEEQVGDLLKALERLSPVCRRIFYLNRFEGLKHREIAERLGISVRTVEENIRRALKHCADSLE